MNRRRLLRFGIAAAGSAAIQAWNPAGIRTARGADAPLVYPFSLPPLAYPHDALEPVIDAQTMQIHHTKHHQAYIDNLNAALKDHPRFHGVPIDSLLRGLKDVPEAIRTAVRNHGGGHVNHQMFWSVMRPPGVENAGGEPQGELAEAINSQFGSLEQFKTAFVQAGTRLFGSGWVFLIAEPGTMKLSILTTPNQDSVFLEPGRAALFGNDCWEHAYYLKYQNRRADYLNAWWGVLSWDAVARRFEQIKTGKSPI